jgi:hypothetical protein
MRLTTRTGAVTMAAVLVGLLAGCGGSPEPQTPRPPRITESFKPELLSFGEGKDVCVPGTGGDALTCEALVHRYLDSVHKVRDAINGRPDADSYPQTLAAIDAVDRYGDDWTGARCPGKLTLDCDHLVDNMFAEDVYNKLSSEDSLTPA